MSKRFDDGTLVKVWLHHDAPVYVKSCQREPEPVDVDYVLLIPERADYSAATTMADSLGECHSMVTGISHPDLGHVLGRAFFIGRG